MPNVLITGMSGSGKSAVIVELGRRGLWAVDLDTAEWSEWVAADPQDTLTPGEGRDWVWREGRVRALLSSAGEGTLFLSGCATNMGALFDRIDATVLLSAPIETLMERLVARSPDGYGQTAEERRRVVDLVATVEPLLRQSADFEIDTRGSVGATVDEILKRVSIVGAGQSRSTPPDTRINASSLE